MCQVWGEQHSRTPSASQSKWATWYPEGGRLTAFCQRHHKGSRRWYLCPSHPRTKRGCTVQQVGFSLEPKLFLSKDLSWGTCAHPSSFFPTPPGSVEVGGHGVGRAHVPLKVMPPGPFAFQFGWTHGQSRCSQKFVGFEYLDLFSYKQPEVWGLGFPHSMYLNMFGEWVKMINKTPNCTLYQFKVFVSFTAKKIYNL